jgi:hopanoid biosynthesis associated radical SAM protein HpnH
MPVPVSQTFRMAAYVLGQTLRGSERYPLVLMLEPLYRCNLACAGCGKTQYPPNILKTQLSVEECVRAVEECPAPVVNIAGGEPLLHPHVGEIVAQLARRKRYIYLCTNALLLEQKLDCFEPSRFLSFSVHLDGLEEEHDFSVCREGVYRKARHAIERALERGFRVTTNTTLYEGADPDRTAQFFDELMRLGVEGMTISPGYRSPRAPDQDRFLAKEQTTNLFRQVFQRGSRRWRFSQSPLFLEFLAGERDYECKPWGNPTYGVFGWQKPCYLLQDGYEDSFQGLIAGTRWERYGPASGNPRCRDCRVHSGFEASAVDEAFSSLAGMAAVVRATLFGPRSSLPREDVTAALRPASAAPAAASRGFASEATPEALRLAFEFRGNVTLVLKDGSTLEGYVANVGDRDLRLWLPAGSEIRRIPLEAVGGLIATGRNRASGKSWKTWRRRYEEDRARAARA